MSDTVVVMNEGKIQQIGSPEDIYNEPKTAFVADFIGESNILDGIMPGMLGMAAFWLYYWLLSKKINPMVLILCTMVVGIIGAYFGVLA